MTERREITTPHARTTTSRDGSNTPMVPSGPITPEMIEKNIEVAKKYALQKQERAIFEVTQTAIKGVTGYDVKITSKESMRKAINSLAGSQRKKVIEIVKAHMKDVDVACAEATKGKLTSLVKIPAKLIAIVTTGATIGTSAAGIVNSVAPGIFNTMCGYIAGSSPEIWKKLAGLGIGFVTDQAIAGKFMLGAGAVVGAVLYTTGRAGIAAIKGIKNMHQKRKSKEIAESR